MKAETTGVPRSVFNILCKLNNLAKVILRPPYRTLRRMLRFIIWVFPSAFILLTLNSAKKRRILIIYDTTSQPFSVGDILSFQVASLMLCERYQVKKVDFAILFDPFNPASSNPVFSGVITEDNVLYHISSLLPLTQVNQNLGSFFVFDSPEQLHQLVADNADLYYVWPPAWKLSSREYLNSTIYNDLIYSHFKRHGSVPELSCRPFLKEWADNFYRKHVFQLIPVTVNIRNNKGWHKHRNSDLDSWLALFHYCETRYPVKFVIICSRVEIDKRLRDCPNVILAKDHHTDVEQDMALIHGSAMHMGAGSGPAVMAFFSKKPYLIINRLEKYEFFKYKDMLIQEEGNIERYWFSSKFQYFITGIETAEILIKEFAHLWGAIDLPYWRNLSLKEQKKSSENLNTWIR